MSTGTKRRAIRRSELVSLVGLATAIITLVATVIDKLL
jgi:hypothetical protein